MLTNRQKNDITRILEKLEAFQTEGLQKKIIKEFKKQVTPIKCHLTIESIFDLPIFEKLTYSGIIYKKTNLPIFIEISRIICLVSDNKQEVKKMKKELQNLNINDLI